MPSTTFPGPKYTKVIEKDPQIVQVPLDHSGWGARPVSTNGSMSQTEKKVTGIKHVKSEG